MAKRKAKGDKPPTQTAAEVVEALYGPVGEMQELPSCGVFVEPTAVVSKVVYKGNFKKQVCDPNRTVVQDGTMAGGPTAVYSDKLPTVAQCGKVVEALDPALRGADVVVEDKNLAAYYFSLYMRAGVQIKHLPMCIMKHRFIPGTMLHREVVWTYGVLYVKEDDAVAAKERMMGQVDLNHLRLQMLVDSKEGSLAKGVGDDVVMPSKRRKTCKALREAWKASLDEAAPMVKTEPGLSAAVAALGEKEGDDSNPIDLVSSDGEVGSDTGGNVKPPAK